MCLQCLTNAILVVKDILPGFNLMQSQQDAEGWPKGAYGLVETNDPTVVFRGPLLKNPMEGLSDDALDNLARMPDGYEEFITAAEELGQNLILDAVTGYWLVRGCMAKGYSREEHGFLHYWLLHYLAKQVEDMVLTEQALRDSDM